ncbi:unnamed protein product, partial [Didymodactylos carnosus]
MRLPSHLSSVLTDLGNIHNNNKLETEKTVDNDGWLPSSDLVIMNDDDYIKLVGRIKDMIIRGGKNIYPKEIEEVLCKHFAINDIDVM